MPDLSSHTPTPTEGEATEPTPPSRSTFAKALSRLQDWFAIQSAGLRLAVLAVAVLIPMTAFYSWSSIQKQELMAQQVKAMAASQTGAEAVWSYNKNLPVVFGTGSVLSFLDRNTVEHITVIYSALSWSVSERFVLIESQGRQYAYYPSDMETRIFSEKAVTAPWGGKLTFVPRSELDEPSAEVLARLEQRFSGARPQSERDAWKGELSALISVGLSVGLLAFLWMQLRGQVKSLKFIEPTQIQGSIDDPVGMDDIKAEVAQIKDQYHRREQYAEYGIDKPFNVMFSGPAGTGKTK
ncbi:MAG: AAA family ATPase, partial [Burkholderiaceae bacterium]|nr:AAA family ATPase [Burkholderiaceae bacterium]